MKKLIMTLMAVMIAIAANAQYNVGTSSRYTDSYGNSTSTHRNQYGQTTGFFLYRQLRQYHDDS